MKIAFVSDSVYPWNFGGLETIERADADALSGNNELHFFSLRWPGMQSEFTKDKIRYHTFHDIDTKKFYRHDRRSIREAVMFSLGLFRIFRYRFDVIQSNEFPILQLPLLKFYCLITGCKLIIDVHEVWDKEYWTKYIGTVWGILAFAYATWALKMANHYIANSTTTKSRLVGLGIPIEKITTFAPIINDSKMAKVKQITQKREIIFVGRLIKEKRLDKWLQVFKKTLKLTKVTGLIIGDGPERPKIEAMIRRLGLQNKVKLEGFYSDENQPMLFRKIKEAGLLLHMSQREGLSAIALESIALGTPVLLPSYTPIPEDVKRMCVVTNEEALPMVAAGILEGEKSVHLRESHLIERFYMSKVPGFYQEIFRKIGIEDR